MKPTSHRALLETISGFINEIGISCTEGPIPEITFLPGIAVVQGSLVYDVARLKYPGDLLHEAGHLAVLLPADRGLANGSDNISGDLDPGGAEMAAIAWSWAAKEALGVPAEVLFHDGGYQEGGDALASNFEQGKYLGHYMLQWIGMTSTQTQVQADMPLYPKMKRWLRQS